MGAAVAPAAVAQPADPIARATPATPADVATPDGRDRAEGYSPSLQDAGGGALGPDARDRASGYQPTLIPEVEVPVADAAAAALPPAVPGGFDWASAGIGAAAGTGLLIMAMAFGTTKLLPGRSRSGVVGA
jgi:hypothetical protein